MGSQVYFASAGLPRVLLEWILSYPCGARSTFWAGKFPHGQLLHLNLSSNILSPKIIPAYNLHLHSLQQETLLLHIGKQVQLPTLTKISIAIVPPDQPNNQFENQKENQDVNSGFNRGSNILSSHPHPFANWSPIKNDRRPQGAGLAQANGNSFPPSHTLDSWPDHARQGIGCGPRS